MNAKIIKIKGGWKLYLKGGRLRDSQTVLYIHLNRPCTRVILSLLLLRGVNPPENPNQCIKITALEDLCFFAKAGKPQFTNVLKWPKITRLRQRLNHSKIIETKSDPKSMRVMPLCFKSSQVNTLPKAKSKTRSKQNKDMHKCSSVYSERGVPLPVLTSGGE